MKIDNLIYKVSLRDTFLQIPVGGVETYKLSRLKVSPETIRVTARYLKVTRIGVFKINITGDNVTVTRIG